MKTKGIKLIIFDFDGTLGDTRRNIIMTMQMTIKELNLPNRNEAECASTIGVPLAVAAGRSFIAPTAAMTIHPVRLNGVVIGVPQTYNYFARIQDRIVRFVTTHSRCPREEYLRLMTNTDELANDIGSVIYGAEAVENGLIDSLGTLSDALDYLHSEMAGKPD